MAQGFFVVGVSMFLIYYGYYDLWALLCTSGLSVFLMVFLMCYKFHLEGFSGQHNNATAPTAGVGDSGGDSEIRTKNSSQRATARAKSNGRLARDAAAGNSTEVQPLMSSW